MLLVQADGSVHRPGRGGMPLGWPYDAEWSERSIRMAPGDVIVAFSDGVLDLYDGTLHALDEVAAVVRTLDTRTRSSPISRPWPGRWTCCPTT